MRSPRHYLVGLTIGFTLGLPATAAASPTVTLLANAQPRSAPSLHASRLTPVPRALPLTGGRTVLPVLGTKTIASTTWLHVRLPGRPNSHTGWIRQQHVRLGHVPYRIVVDRAARRVRVYRGARLVHAWLAVIGTASTPTPHGQFYVEEPLDLRGMNEGPYALALSARSNVFATFDGGPGQVAIHGTDGIGGVPGQAQSHGCIRLTDGIVWLGTHITAGTSVVIR